jgi:hypothetical protein
MSHVNADRVLDSSTSTGTGIYGLNGNITGFRGFTDALAPGDTCHYVAWNVDTNGNPNGAWEIGVGRFDGADLERLAIISSSNSNNAVNWTAGTRRVAVTTPASQINPETPIRERRPNILIPAYGFIVPPADTDANVVAIRNVIRDNPSVAFTVIMTTATSGPGIATEAKILRALRLYQGDGARGIGYVTTARLDSKTVAQVVAECLTWRTLYPGIDGVFLDEFGYTVAEFSGLPAVRTAKRALYKALIKTLEGLGFNTIFCNSGTTLESAWYRNGDDVFGARVATIIAEGNAFPSQAVQDGTDPNWPGDPTHSEHPVPQRGSILNNVAVLDATAVRNAMRSYGTIYVTSDSGYQTMPAYLPALARIIGGAGSATIEVELDLGSVPVYDKAITFTASGATVGQRVTMTHSGNTATGRDADENEMDALIARAYVSATNQITAFVSALPGPVTGKYKFNLQLG